MTELLAKAESEGYEVRDDEGQARKSARGMPWHQEPKKVVISCDKPRGAAHKRYIRGSLNGATRHGSYRVSHA